jgi:hypothetical protein
MARNTAGGRIECIDLEGEETFEVASDVTSIGQIYLHNHGGLALPTTLTQVDRIELEVGELHLPNTVKRIGELEIWYSDSILRHAGVESFGKVVLHQADFEFAEGVHEIGSLDAETSSVRLPTTLKKVGNVQLSHDYDAQDTIQWPEGTAEVGGIRMSGPTKIRLPKSVRTVGALDIGEGARLEVPAATEIRGDCRVSDGGELVRY